MIKSSIKILLIIVSVLCLSSCNREETTPRQPIAFSHKIHAGQYKLNCQYCHSGVRRTNTAYIPSVRLCMGCHQLVAANKPEIVKVRTAFEKQEPIQWMRVNRLADFVYFNHYPHVAKGFDCSTCHGDIAGMTEVKQVVKVNNMTWCVDCHRKNNGPTDCYTCHR